MPKIFEAIPKIMAEVDPIKKNRTNTQGSGYKFRGIDDVYQALQAILAKHGVFTVPTVLEERSEERTSRSGGTLVYRILKMQFTFYADDGSSFSSVVLGEGMDSGDKASNKAMSVAHKYALLQVFCIPTDEAKDPEHETHFVAPRTQPTPTMNAKTAETTQAIVAELENKYFVTKEMIRDFLGLTPEARPTQADISKLHIALLALRRGEDVEDVGFKMPTIEVKK